jgi:hypothetical protein
MARLKAKTRNNLPAKDFAGPDRSYPINDMNHARDALARVSEFGAPELKAAVRAKVAKKFPGITQDAPKKAAGGKIDGVVPKHRMDRASRGR